MRKRRAYLSIILMVLAIFVSKYLSAGESYLEKLVGKKYAYIRNELLSHGDRPGRGSTSTGINCTVGRESICRHYPETLGCAGDVDTPCKFAWKTKNGRIYYVITKGYELDELKVIGIDQRS